MVGRILAGMGRTSDAKERLLEASAALFSRRPYSSVGVSEICLAAGVPKGSFYYFFPSKQDLALAVINVHWDWQQQQWARILGQNCPVIDRVHELFDFTAQIQNDGLKDSGVVAGCLFGNLALELSSTEPDVRARLQEIFERQVLMIEQALSDGDTAPQSDSLHQVATTLVAQLEGLVLLAKLFRRPAQVTDSWAAVAHLLTPQPA